MYWTTFLCILLEYYLRFIVLLRFVLIHIDNIIFITLREFTDRFDWP